jgi:7-cyano-7-deazaguanine synthase
MELSEEKRRDALVLMSGGIDSACCAHFLKSKGYHVNGLFIDFGQLASESEAEKSKEVAKWISCDLNEIKVQIPSSNLSSDGEIVGRNAFLLSSALMFNSGTASVIGIGIHAGTPYYDCGSAFLDRMCLIVREYTGGKCHLSAPFIDWNKQEVYSYAKSIKLPIEITYSCEAKSNGVCGVCRSCKDRELYNC